MRLGHRARRESVGIEGESATEGAMSLRSDELGQR
jgi:hypothetical protein